MAPSTDLGRTGSPFAWRAASKPRIAIVGGGISGLTLAIALRRLGRSADIFEQAPELVEIGAGLSLFANALKPLQRLGVYPRLVEHAVQPTDLLYCDGTTGESLVEIPLNRDGRYERTFGIPYLTIHRRRVQEALLSEIDHTRLHLNHRVQALEADDDAVYLSFENGQSHEFDVVVGADGARSCVRQWITGSQDAVYSGTSAFRGVVPLSAAPSVQRGDAPVFWVGAGKHLLHFPIEDDAVTFFAAVDEPPTWDHAEWRLPIAAAEAASAFAGWHPAVTELLGANPHLERWALFVTRPLERWSRGPVVVIGDAAHAMLPHQGQGANQAIEDAVFLADVLVEADRDGIREALVAFEQARGPRTRRVQELSWATNHLLHVPKGTEWEARNAALPNFYDTVHWIHSFELPTSRARPPAHHSP